MSVRIDRNIAYQVIIEDNNTSITHSMSDREFDVLISDMKIFEKHREEIKKGNLSICK